MVKKCLYCSIELAQENIIDFCDRCGINVFGTKMLNTIKQNMENARSRGDLCHMNNTCEIPEEQPENL